MSLRFFRWSSNSMEPSADLFTDFCRELCYYTDESDQKTSFQTPSSGIMSGPRENTIDRLTTIALNNKREQLLFFDTSNGEKLKIDIHSNFPVSKNLPWSCSFCATFSNRMSVHWRSHRCNLCHVHLCIRSLKKHHAGCPCILKLSFNTLFS